MLKLFTGIFLLASGLVLDVLSAIDIYNHPSLAQHIMISWGFVGIGLTMMGVGNIGLHILAKKVR